MVIQVGRELVVIVANSGRGNKVIWFVFVTREVYARKGG